MNSSALQGSPTSDPHFQPVPAHFDPRAGQEEVFRRLLIQDWIRVVDVDVHFTFDPQSGQVLGAALRTANRQDRKSTRLNSSHVRISYAVFCLKKKKQKKCTAEDGGQRG